MTIAPARTFIARPAQRESVPLLMGIMSPSGGGKTYSALRLATGMQRILGGEIYGIDTENSRMLHYADAFRFQHVPFGPPFGSLDYLQCLEWCQRQGARITIVDSMTHEHIGAGGYLETAEQTIDRIAGNDWRKREACKMLGWAAAGPKRQHMIEGIKQLSGAFIFCFRAKEKAKPVRGADGKTEVVDLGYMPIAGEDWIYEMAVNCMLEPRSDGVPTWRSDHVGSRMMMKLPAHFRAIFPEGRPLDEETGAALANWMQGGQALPHGPMTSPDHAADHPPGANPPHAPAPGGPVEEVDRIAQLDLGLAAAAELGLAELHAEWQSMAKADQRRLKASLDRRHKPHAIAVDDAKAAGT